MVLTDVQKGLVHSVFKDYVHINITHGAEFKFTFRLNKEEFNKFKKQINELD